MKRMKFKTRRKRTPPYFSREPEISIKVVTKVVTFIKKSGHLFSRDKLLFYRLLKPIYYDNKSKHFIF